MRDFRLRRVISASMRSMAILMRSAAVPCSGVLTAVRSAKPRWLGLREWMSGMGRMRPKAVRTAWSRRTMFERAFDEGGDALVAVEVFFDVGLGDFLVDV